MLDVLFVLSFVGLISLAMYINRIESSDDYLFFE